MALTPAQEIEAARKRIQAGIPGAKDVANVKYYDDRKGRSLEGTLPGRSLPENGDTTSIFKGFLKQIELETMNKQPSAMDVLSNFQAKSGLSATAVASTPGIVTTENKMRLENLKNMQLTALDMVEEQEKRKEAQREENLKWGETLFKSVEDPFSTFSDDDIKNLRLGIITPEIKAKAGRAKTAELGRKKSGGDLTPTDARNLNAFSTLYPEINMSTWTPQMKNALLKNLSPKEQKDFMREYADASKNMSVDPISFLRKFASKLDANDFTPQEVRKLEAAGLLDASRSEQLKFLYDKKSSKPSWSSTK